MSVPDEVKRLECLGVRQFIVFNSVQWVHDGAGNWTATAKPIWRDHGPSVPNG